MTFEANETRRYGGQPAAVVRRGGPARRHGNRWRWGRRRKRRRLRRLGPGRRPRDASESDHGRMLRGHVQPRIN
jgi:hypothetical protein